MFNFFKKKEPVVIKSNVQIKEDYDDIVPLANYFQNLTGITFDQQISILKNKVISFCKQRNIYSFKELLNNIQSQQVLKQELIDHLTTNETYFYRETKQIFELVQLVKDSNTSVNILCAPSASGEEPYSIAISLIEEGILPSKFRIVGIDINADAVSKSKNAVYGERNVRKLSPDIISKYFKKVDNTYYLDEKIKSLVSFEISNLFEKSFERLGRFDFVFSRNMLIYFDKETKLRAKTILESMRKSDKYPVFFGHADLF